MTIGDYYTYFIVKLFRMLSNPRTLKLAISSCPTFEARLESGCSDTIGRCKTFEVTIILTTTYHAPLQ